MRSSLVPCCAWMLTSWNWLWMIACSPTKRKLIQLYTPEKGFNNRDTCSRMGMGNPEVLNTIFSGKGNDNDGWLTFASNPEPSFKKGKKMTGSSFEQSEHSKRISKYYSWAPFNGKERLNYGIKFSFSDFFRRNVSHETTSYSNFSCWCANAQYHEMTKLPDGDR